MTDLARCTYCAMFHAGMCPRVKEIRYRQDGTIESVVFRDLPPPQPISIDPKFSNRQREVLELICMGKQNKHIAYELGLAEATVKVHVRCLLRKANAANRAQLVRETMEPRI